MLHGNGDFSADRIQRCIRIDEAISLATEVNTYPGTGSLRERLERTCTTRDKRRRFRHGDIQSLISLGRGVGQSSR